MNDDIMLYVLTDKHGTNQYNVRRAPRGPAGEVLFGGRAWRHKERAAGLAQERACAAAPAAPERARADAAFE